MVDLAMDENDVVDAVARWLESHGFQIDQRLTTKEQGVDLIASRADGARWMIEAKGGRSSREGSARYGMNFTDNQTVDRVMKGVFTCLELAERADRDGAQIGFAIPRSKTAERLTGRVRQAIGSIGITVLWIEPDGSVSAA